MLRREDIMATDKLPFCDRRTPLNVLPPLAKSHVNV